MTGDWGFWGCWKVCRICWSCCPCVVWNSWATAAKASELGSCGTAGTEFAVTCGGSEGTLAGGGGEPGGVQEHRKGCQTPQGASCSPQQVAAACTPCLSQKGLFAAPQLHFLFVLPWSALLTAHTCTWDALRQKSCSHTEFQLPALCLKLCRFRKALTTQTTLGSELQYPERGGSASTGLAHAFGSTISWLTEEQLSFSQYFPPVTELLQRSLAIIKGF